MVAIAGALLLVVSDNGLLRDPLCLMKAVEVILKDSLAGEDTVTGLYMKEWS